MNSETPDNLDQSEIKDILKAEIKIAELTSKALFEGAEKLNIASQKFAEKAPGQRASWLGFILIFIAIFVELTSAISVKFDFSDINSTSMLIMGGVLVIFGAAFDTYFTIKVAQSHELRAKELENAAQEAAFEARKYREKSAGILERLIGK